MEHSSVAAASRAEAGSRPLVRWHTTDEEITALRGPWTALEQRAEMNTVFARWLFRVLWYRCFAPDGDSPLCGTLWHDGELIGVAPMVLRRTRMHGVPVLRVDFSGYQIKQGEFLCDPACTETAERLFRAILEDIRPDVGTIIGPPIESSSFGALRSIAVAHGFEIVARPHHYSIIRLDAGYDAYFASLKRAFRSNVRRYERRLREHAVRQEAFGNRPHDPAIVRAAVDRMVSVVRSSWRADYGESMPQSWRSIYTDAALAFAEEGNLRLDFLVIDETDAAFLYALLDGDTLYDMTIGYRKEFKPLAPGTVLMQRLLRRYAAEGIKTVVSQGPYPYKRHWSTGQIPQSELFFFGPSVRGRLSRFIHVHAIPHVEAWRAKHSRWYGAENR